MKRGDTKVEHPKARDTDTDTLTTFDKRIPALLQVQNPNTSGQLSVMSPSSRSKSPFNVVPQEGKVFSHASSEDGDVLGSGAKNAVDFKNLRTIMFRVESQQPRWITRQRTKRA